MIYFYRFPLKKVNKNSLFTVFPEMATSVGTEIQGLILRGDDKKKKSGLLFLDVMKMELFFLYS